MFTHPQFDPVAVHLGPISIRWYGLMYLLAFVMFVLLGRHRLRSYSSSTWTRRDLDDMVFLGVLGVVLGGRLGYVFFYKFSEYLTEPWRAFFVWEGGMSFHGGMLGVILAMIWFARTRNKPWLAVTDFIAPLVPPGLGAGRLGNFINAELWGRATDVPWGIIFPNVDNQVRHASAALSIRRGRIDPLRGIVVVLSPAAAHGCDLRSVPRRVWRIAFSGGIHPRAGRSPGPAGDWIVHGPMAESAHDRRRYRAIAVVLSTR